MRKQIFWLLLVFLIVACQETDAEPFSEPTRPTILISTENQSVQGELVNICWPKGVGNTSCEPTFNVNTPTEELVVARDGVIQVNFGEAIPPDELVVRLRDESLSEPSFELNLQAANEFRVESLNEGRNLLEITAYYYDVAGTQGVVSSLFAVNVGTQVAVQPTETTEPDATEEVGVEETPQISPEPTETTEPDATATATFQPTQTTPPEPTETESAGVGETPQASTPTATIQAIAPSATATVEVVFPSPEPTETFMSGPIVTNTLPPSSPTLDPSGQVPTATVTPFNFVPSATPTSTITPTATNTIEPSATFTDAISFVGEAPVMTMRVTAQEYAPAGLRYCRRASNNQQVCIDQPVQPSTSRIQIGRGNSIRLEIEAATRPERVTYRFIDFGTLRTVESEERLGDQSILVRVNVAAGSYLLAVDFSWADGRKATYYFQVTIVN